MELINGGISVDERGSVTFVNGFNFDDVERFYMVENRKVGQVRAWHGHEVESKYVFVVSGTAKIGIMDMITDKKEFVVLSSRQPRVLYIPPGKYNGSESLEENTKIMYFSTATLEESIDDDYRREVKTW